MKYNFLFLILNVWCFYSGSISKEVQDNIKPTLTCNLDQTILDEIHSYQDVVNQIIDLFINGNFKGETYYQLATFTDYYGPRITGSQVLEDSLDYMITQALLNGYDSSYGETVTVPHWIRNNESAYMISPRTANLNFMSFGGSVGTPSGGIEASVLVVTSFDELTQLADQAVGKIVVYNQPWQGYGLTVGYRSRGAIEAARVGAVASLTRAVADFSIDSPHTGQMNYDPTITEIPSGSISVEDAKMLYRLQNEGHDIKIRLEMGCENLPPISSKNAILELRGSEIPDEIVVVSGHLDSWDVGTGVMDDAGGCFISYLVGVALKNMTLTPKRSIHTVLFTGEEFGIYGGDAYYVAHKNESYQYQLLIESDAGTFNPYGIAFSGDNEGACMVQEILSLMGNANTTELSSPSDLPDLNNFKNEGVPTASLHLDRSKYFWYHHSNGDKMDVDDPDTLDRISALWTAFTYVVADVSFRIPTNATIN